MEFNPLNIERMVMEFERYLPSAFDESLTTVQKVQKIYNWLLENVKLTNEMVAYLNEFIKNFDEKLYDTVSDILKEWYDSGIFDEIITNILSKILDEIENQKNMMLKALPSYDYLDRQKIVGLLPTRLESYTNFIQSFSINEEDNELYVIRKNNSTTSNIISIYNLETFELKSSKELQTTSASAYTEGLCWFKNANNELCFFIRMTYDQKMAIFNYTTGTLGSSFNVEGGSKIACDTNRNYLLSVHGDAEHSLFAYIYDFSSCIAQTPKLIAVSRFDPFITYGEKIQSVTIMDHLIVLAHGKQYPMLTVLNFDGNILRQFPIKRSSLADLISKTDDCINEGQAYENEGVYPVIRNGKEVLLVAHLFTGTEKVYFAECGDIFADKLEAKLYTENIRSGMKWIDFTDDMFLDRAANYANDVKCQYAFDREGNIHLRGVLTYPKESIGEPDNGYYYANLKLVKFGFPILARRPTWFKTVAGGNPTNTNRMVVRTYDNITYLILESTNDTSGKPFGCLDGIVFVNDLRSDF